MQYECNGLLKIPTFSPRLLCQINQSSMKATVNKLETLGCKKKEFRQRGK